jgi:O-antigen ligase
MILVERWNSLNDEIAKRWPRLGDTPWTVVVLVGLSLSVLASSVGSIAIVAVLAMPVGLACAIVLGRYPFIGLLLLVFFSQVDALASVIFSAVSDVSPIKALTALTLLAAVFRYRLELFNRTLTNEPYIARFLLALMGAILISALFARETGMALDEARRIAAVMILVLLVGGIATSLKQIEALAIAIIVSTLISSLFVLYDWRTGGASFVSALTETRSSWQNVYRPSGASLDGAPMAATMLLCGTSLAIFLAVRTPRWRLITIPTALFGTLGIGLTLTRSATLTLAMLLLWLLWKLRHHRNWFKMLACLAIAGVIVVPLLPPELWDKLSTIFNNDGDTTLLRRLSYHIIGVDQFLEQPIVGIGAGNFPIYYGDFENRFVPGRSELRPLHNQYLQYMVESGLIGGLAYIALLFTAFLSLRDTYLKARSAELSLMAEALLFSFTSIVIQMLYLSSKFNKYLWIYIGLAIAVRAVFNDERSKNQTL